MAVSSLFPNDSPLAPAADRTEPAFWLRRLIVIPDLIVDAQPIRDITFRRGLNIIRTEPRNESDETVLGHDVGKTLLTRLIRYTLGEQTFARRSEHRRILERNEASMLLRWLMGLFDAREFALREQHLALTSKRQHLQSESQRLYSVLGSADPILQRKLGLTDDLLIGEGLFAEQMDAALDTEIQKLESLRCELRTESRIAALETEEDGASATHEVAMKAFAAQDARVQFLRAQLEVRLSASSSGGYLTNSPFESCSQMQCPMKLENRATPTPDPAHDDITSSLREEISDEQRKLLQQTHHCDQLRARQKDIRRQLRAEQLRLLEVEAGINRSIGRWETHREDVEFRKDIVRKMDEYKAESRRLRSEIKQSAQRQEMLRKQQQKQLRQMSDAFSQVLKNVFSSTANGRFKVDATGLRPEVDEQTGSGGAALSAMAKVLSFDLGCLSASIAGIGSHPRFVVHDSPRASDIEEQLFHQLFRVVVKWEKSFPPEESSFQYIITTTPPPPEMAGADVPFMRLTLSARTDHDRLLRVRY